MHDERGDQRSGGLGARRAWCGLRPLAVAGVAITLVAGAAPSTAPARPAQPFPGIRFDARAHDRLVITTPAYRLALSKRNGRILELVDRAKGALLRGSAGCLWRAVSEHGPSLVGGCAFTPGGARRFSYKWSQSSATLTLGYRAPNLGSATVTVRARGSFFDLRLAIRNRGAVVTKVPFPEDLFGAVATVEAGYAPNVLPGVRLTSGFFSRLGNNLQIYPSRWAFADYLALDVAGGHIALYSVNSGPIAPLILGFLRQPPAGRCSGPFFCIVHQFQTWIEKGTSWTSPAVRVRIGATAQQSILAYRQDNGIDKYPSVQRKLGPQLTRFAQAPLIKADLRKLKPFGDWGPELRRLPSPALLHPVGFQPGGHDESDPDFLPPDPQWGTSADFASAVQAAHALGQLVMPYLNVSWWADRSPTLKSLPPPLQRKDIAVIDEQGRPVVDGYGEHSGLVVSPYAPFVRDRVARELEEWRTEVPADCLFFDQVGARPWIRDFNVSAPDPDAYYDGWLGVLAQYSNRCLMVEDGWDRLARDVSGFHGSMLMMAREHDAPNALYGKTNWAPYPLADWLFHDKVLLYQHDLYEGTMATDGQVLTWNMAFGLISSYVWDDVQETLESPWLGLVGELQRAVGPSYAGKKLTRYRDLGPGVTESTFGDLVVTATWDSAGVHETGGFGIAANGFMARTPDDRLLAGAFEDTFDGAPLTAGVHYVIVQRDGSSTVVRQPLGPDTELAVEPPLSWSSGRTLRAVAIASDGTTLGPATGEVQNGRFVFRYAAELNGRAVAGYRLSLD